ncbi:MAG: hypothetical protein ACD_78C00197G0028 [uncultured bacterium (gcode 4)]|uniref:Uncharacterized protein n=1 Tax=uncultured bacterium (gcode 4) TaxID=1234023 RepID=K1YCG2_9BACT|nr:MAG: hypothetical protein ACD_78C00197G0028 [uncultured bacterium (gcode 4)]
MSLNALWEKPENMNIKPWGLSVMELIQLATHRVITEEEIVQMQKRFAEAEEKFERKARNKRTDAKWLEKTYSI